MTSPVTKAMIESYALMILVMGTFFVYFCGMVWAFCNPKLSGAEEDCVAEKAAAGRGDERWISSPDAPERSSRCACGRRSTPPLSTHTTYVHFWDDDTDSLLSHCTTFCPDNRGINNQIGLNPSWTGHADQLVI